ncbi:SanA/YdcF family protein [Aeromonas australiensis]|uniref:SanA/YdcF family protein n=1 Tax=Aeromonas australiensis TaxID=1114880 RepID=UPI00058A075F|nr:ElyC/SanA/YdcF family protein [Aeromonas australiensis]
MKKFAKILLACLVLLLALIAILLGYSEWIVSDARHYTHDQVDKVPYNRVAVVLGTSTYLSGGGPNHYFKYRIKAAAELYNHAKVDYIIVSGDNATLQYNEPRQMRRALIKAGIPASAIYMDFAGFRTLDSVVRAKEVFGQDRFTVVSQGFHNERAIFIARHFGIDAIGFNAKDPSAYQGIRTRVREVFARLMGLLDLYVLDKGPKFLGEPVPIGLPEICHSLSTIGSLQPCLTQPKPAVAQAKPAAVSAAASATPSASAATEQLTPALSAATTTEPVTPAKPAAETPGAALPILPVAPSAASTSTTAP